MANLRDAVAYVCDKYPYKNDLSKSRLTKLIYLADWKMSLDTGTQITPTRWYFNHFGPYVADIENLARTDDAFLIEQSANYYGRQKEIVRLRTQFVPTLSPVEMAAADFAIEKTKNLGWDSFIKLVYSTYPVLTESKYEFLDLPKLAKEYKKTSIDEAK